MCKMGCEVPEEPTFNANISIADVCLNPAHNNKFERALVISNDKGSCIIFENLFHCDFQGAIDMGVEVKYLKEIKL